MTNHPKMDPLPIASASAIGPVIFERGGTPEDVTVGRHMCATVKDPTRWTAASSDPRVVSVPQGRSRDGATLAPGEALQARAAIGVLTNSQNPDDP